MGKTPCLHQHGSNVKPKLFKEKKINLYPLCPNLSLRTLVSNFQAKTFASKDNFFNDVLTILAETSVIKHIFSVCFQVAKMCENAPQNSLSCQDGARILKILSGGKTASLKGRV